MFQAVSQCIVFGGGTHLTVLGKSPTFHPLSDPVCNLGLFSSAFFCDLGSGQRSVVSVSFASFVCSSSPLTGPILSDGGQGYRGPFP